MQLLLMKLSKITWVGSTTTWVIFGYLSEIYSCCYALRSLYSRWRAESLDWSVNKAKGRSECIRKRLLSQPIAHAIQKRYRPILRF